MLCQYLKPGFCESTTTNFEEYLKEKGRKLALERHVEVELWVSRISSRVLVLIDRPGGVPIAPR